MADPEDFLTAEQRALYEVMSDISEAHWCAGWYSGVEHQIWRALATGDDRWIPASEPRLPAVHLLSKATDSWIEWTDGEHGPGPYPVPLSEWAARPTTPPPAAASRLVPPPPNPE